MCITLHMRFARVPPVYLHKNFVSNLHLHGKSLEKLDSIKIRSRISCIFYTQCMSLLNEK